jgi:hypothetical protein
MAEELKGRIVGGEGKVAEVDGGYFGGYIKFRLSEAAAGKHKLSQTSCAEWNWRLSV